MSKIINDAQDFNEMINQDKLTLIDFFADWCGPCKMLAPVIDELTEEFGQKHNIAKVNTDDFNDIATEYNIRTIPTIIFFKNGKELDRLIGVFPKEEIIEKINQFS